MPLDAASGSRQCAPTAPSERPERHWPSTENASSTFPAM